MALTLSKRKMSLEILLTTDSPESLLRHVTNPELLNFGNVLTRRTKQ